MESGNMSLLSPLIKLFAGRKCLLCEKPLHQPASDEDVHSQKGIFYACGKCGALVHRTCATGNEIPCPKCGCSPNWVTRFL